MPTALPHAATKNAVGSEAVLETAARTSIREGDRPAPRGLGWRSLRGTRGISSLLID